MQEVFQRYAAFGANRQAKDVGLENVKFAKLCRENDLLDRTQADLVWTKVMRKERKMNFEQFKIALQEIAKVKGVDLTQVEAKLGGPKTTGATEFADDDWVKRQTDVGLYTGKYKHKFDAATGKGIGAAGDKDDFVPQDLTQLLDRTPADIRGRK
ncbi:p25-alpha [Gregarina niphandrodes]|uniref:P25-alpha n=1 Tax=Gregarina niphandrodes TaxID=110365 RepID=A0A023BA70_GRENI|nr:p25-alpha [Gregarina niphandrodes]EZG78138.1 p25-alpha [Gregarina niphandrodes]|eukprot:XP_011129452.1 p25-alpha [Gregarina niphandrodes]